MFFNVFLKDDDFGSAKKVSKKHFAIFLLREKFNNV